MLARFSKVTVSSARLAANTNKAMGARFFSEEQLTIPTDKENQGGRRKEELDAYDKGGEAFSGRNSLVPPNDQGTKENPIMVPSQMNHRTIGFENPSTHQLVWFDLHKGPLHYVPDVDLYFKLKSFD